MGYVANADLRNGRADFGKGIFPIIPLHRIDLDQRREIQNQMVAYPFLPHFLAEGFSGLSEAGF